MAADNNSEESPRQGGPEAPDWRRYRRALRWLGLLFGLSLAAAYFGLFGRLGLSLPEGLLHAILGNRTHPETPRFTEVAADRVPLMDRFRSYDDLDTVKHALTAAGYERWESSNRRYRRSSEYPPKDFDALFVDRYEHLGVEGRLSLFFFNNRLYQVEFQPSDARAYATGLRRLGLRPRAEDNARVEVVKGNLRIVSTVALAASAVGRQMRTPPWAMWQDQRLVRQSEEWDARYGGIPKPAVPG